jgi:hypothetical protein
MILSPANKEILLLLTDFMVSDRSAMDQIGDKWRDPARHGKPMRLTHTSCGRGLQAQVKCSECGDKLKAQDVKFFRDAVA